jgi:hypothetical protein
VAVGLAIGLSVYPESELEGISQLGRLAGLTGVALMIVALVRGVPRVVGWAAVILLAQYGLSLVSRAAVDPLAPVYAATLLLMVETAYSSLEWRARLAGPSGTPIQAVGRLLALGLAGLGLAALVLALASVPLAYGLLVQVAGVGAAAAVLTTLITLVRRRA